VIGDQYRNAALEFVSASDFNRVVQTPFGAVQKFALAEFS
jgi:hypothetical protein